jgi:hypothetical protein
MLISTPHSQEVLTEVELAVELFTVDYVEAVFRLGSHVADLKVEPLVVVVGVHVRVNDQIILKVPHLMTHKTN